jgi:hypothetical protein
MMMVVVMMLVTVVVVCGMGAKACPASRFSFPFLHQAPVCGPHEASACSCHCQFSQLLRHASHGSLTFDHGNFCLCDGYVCLFGFPFIFLPRMLTYIGLHPPITSQRELDLFLAILVAG